MSGSDDNFGQAQLNLPLSNAADAALGPYSEEVDDMATSFFETPHPEPPWLVQVTPFDRRVWSRERVLQELLRQSALIHRDTLVWRRGMSDWRRIEQLQELHGGTPLPPAPTPRRRARGGWLGASPAGDVWLCGAAALLTICFALAALLVAGVFEPQLARSPAPASSMATAVHAP